MATHLSPEVTSPAIAAQHAVLSKQLSELATLRRDMQGLYDHSQAELREARSAAAAAAQEAAQERAQNEATCHENTELRRWNTKLAEDLSFLRSELRSLERSISAGMPSEDHEDDDNSLDIQAELRLWGQVELEVDAAMHQQYQLEASANALKLARTRASLRQRQKELRASSQKVVQLQNEVQSVSADLEAATAQIGKLETRIRKQAQETKAFEQVSHRTREANRKADGPH